MINQNLHRKPVALDRVKHRTLKLDIHARDLSIAKKMNAFFVAGSEFHEACKEYPVVFVPAGKDPKGNVQVAPIAVFGLKPEQNLCIDGDAWRVRYVPAMMRLYPFAMARADGEQLVMCFDDEWSGFGEQGEALFDEQGEPTELVKQVQERLEGYEADVERTRMACRMLMDKGLLREMRFNAKLPDGSDLGVDGFQTVDEDKLKALPDADLVAFQRNGLLALIHAHLISLTNMPRLVEWHVQRLGGGAPAPAAGA
jgi:hypothetical protein